MNQWDVEEKTATQLVPFRIGLQGARTRRTLLLRTGRDYITSARARDADSYDELTLFTTRCTVCPRYSSLCTS
jgi:hypothetical protein